MSSIFISYRRTDSEGYAGRIFDRLHQEFGNQVFRDVDTIDGGTRFPDEIARQLGVCKVVLVVIGPNWLDTQDESGKRRLEDPKDWVRIEVSTALSHNVCVIPVTVGGAQLPAAKDLPKDLKGLVQLQRRDLRDGDTWDNDLHLLVRRVANELGVDRSRFKRTMSLSLVLASVLVLAGLYVLRSRVRVPTPPVTVQSKPLAAKEAPAPAPVQPALTVAGKWNTPVLKNPYAANETFRLDFEFEMFGDKLTGTVTDSGQQFAIFDGKVTGNIVSFHTRSEVILGNETKPYKELYDGRVIGDRIEFRRQDDLPNGGIPLKFMATRLRDRQQ